MLLTLLLSSAVSAATPDLQRCRAVVDDAERLTCYDALTQGKVHDQPRPAQADGVEQFGMNEQIAARPQAQSLSAVVTDIRKLPYGQLLLTLDNHQVWQQLRKDRGLRVKKGDRVNIKRGTLGAYRLIGRGKRAYKVKRLQ